MININMHYILKYSDINFIRETSNILKLIN